LACFFFFHFLQCRKLFWFLFTWRQRAQAIAGDASDGFVAGWKSIALNNASTLCVTTLERGMQPAISGAQTKGGFLDVTESARARE